MGTFTSRLKLFKPATSDVVDVAVDLNTNFDLMDTNVGAIVCTSSTRPSGGALYTGLFIYETDTGLAYVYNGSAFVTVAQPAPSSGIKQRLATSTRTTTPGTFTAETITDTVTFNAVNTGVYGINYIGSFASSVGTDLIRNFLREDNVTGTSRCGGSWPLPAANTAQFIVLYAEWTATATGSKTFVATGQRLSGTGNITASGSVNSPAVLSVERLW